MIFTAESAEGTEKNRSKWYSPQRTRRAQRTTVYNGIHRGERRERWERQ